MIGRSYLRLPGSRYRCTPQYVQSDEMDPLLTLFLRVLEHEQDATRLINAFGLGTRVTEDVLAELIRRSRATLVIDRDRKLIRPVPGLPVSPRRDNAEPLDVWQDHATGIVLPAFAADAYSLQPHSPTIRVLSSHRRMLRGFLDAGHAELIEMLLRSDERLRLREEEYAMLDRLADRYRLRPQTMWLPLDETELGGQPLVSVVADRLPLWASRLYSAALRRGDSGRATLDEIASIIRQSSAEEAARLLRDWRQDARVDAWRIAVQDVLTSQPRPRSGYDLRHVRDRQAELLGLFMASGVALLHDRTTISWDWLDASLDNSPHWGIIVMPWPGLFEAMIAALRLRAQKGRNLPNTLIIVTGEDVGDNDLINDFNIGDCSVLWVRRPWPRGRPAVAIGDSTDVMMRFHPNSRPVRLSGVTCASEWLAFLQTLENPAAEQQMLDPFRRLQVNQLAADRALAVRLGTHDGARSVKLAVEELRSFQQMLLTAIVDPEAFVPASDSSPEAGATRFERDATLGEQLPLLFESCTQLSESLRHIPLAPAACFTRFEGHELLNVLVSVLLEWTRQLAEDEIHMIVSQLSLKNISPELTLLLAEAVGRRCTVHIGVGQDRSEVSPVLSELRVRIPSHRLRFWHLGEPAPLHGLVIRDLTILIGGDWLETVLEEVGGPPDFGLGIESQSFAESTRALFAGAKELSPPAQYS